MRHERDEFEARLADLAPKEIDPTWRDAILTSASAEQPAGLSWLLPKPLVAGLAACWLFIGVLHFINRSDTPQSELALPANPSPTAPATLFNLQRQLLALQATSNQGDPYE